MSEKYYIGKIFEDTYPSDLSGWCAENSAAVIEIDPLPGRIRRFEIQRMPKPSAEQKQVFVRAVRDQYINSIEWRISRYRAQKELGMDTTDKDNDYLNILRYIQYLRDYTKSSADWYEQEPKTFEKWSKK